jgi:cyanophycinase
MSCINDARSAWFAARRVALALLVLGVAVCQSRAADNPFGLPLPRDENRVGAVMLHGGGRGLNDEIRQEFVRLAGGKRARITLMPSDMCQRAKDADGNPLPDGESVADYESRLSTPREYGRWVALRETGQVADFQFLYRDEADDPAGEKLYSLLEHATGVWLPAYDQTWLPKEFAGEYPKRASRFQLTLREVVARGGVVGGLGGAMASLPETMIAGDAPVERGWVQADLSFGLALFSGAVVDQNFDAREGRLERLTDLLRNGPRLDRLKGAPGVERRTIGLGVERHTAMILQGNAIRVIGEGRGHVFLKSNGDRTITWRTLSAGDDSLVIEGSTARAMEKREPESAARRDARNPFGLPEPSDPSRPGTVVLHGGGSTDEIIELLPTLAGSSKPRMVHCPAARESCRPSAACNGKELAERLEQVFDDWRKLQREGRLQALTFVTTSDPADADRPEFVGALKQADALWFCGGDQQWLGRLFAGQFDPTLFQREVVDIVRRGGVVGGSSAGLAVMPDVMIEGGQSENGRPAQAELSRGIGVLKQVLAEQHFDARSGRIHRLTSLLRNHKRLANFLPACSPRKMIGLAVEEDTALVVQANRLRVVGDKSAHVFLQEADPRVVAWHALLAGDAAILREGTNGYVLELDEWRFGE